VDVTYRRVADIVVVSVGFVSAVATAPTLMALIVSPADRPSGSPGPCPVRHPGRLPFPDGHRPAAPPTATTRCRVNAKCIRRGPADRRPGRGNDRRRRTDGQTTEPSCMLAVSSLLPVDEDDDVHVSHSVSRITRTRLSHVNGIDSTDGRTDGRGRIGLISDTEWYS